MLEVFTTTSFFSSGLAPNIALVGLGAFMLRQSFKERRRAALQSVRFEDVSKRLQLALKACDIGVWELELTTGRLFWDERVEQLFDVQVQKDFYSAEDWRNRLHPEDLHRVENEFAKSIEFGTVFQCTFRILTRDGSIRFLRAFGTVDKKGIVPRVVGANWDVTNEIVAHSDLIASKQATEQQNAHLQIIGAELEHQALHDALTGSGNRRKLDQVLKSTPLVNGGRLLAILVDIDNFKYINDTYGAHVGDAALKSVAVALQNTVSPADLVCRVGGDEFVIVKQMSPHVVNVMDLADGISDQLLRNVEVAGRSYSISCSMGAAVGYTGEAATETVHNAGVALHEAKKAGGRRCVWFDDELQDRSKKMRHLRDGIRRAIERNEIEAFFQPQFCAHTYQIVGAETLARWNHPELGFVAPNLFLPIAAELNLIADIDAIVLEKAIAHLAAMESVGLQVPKVSVNVSAQRLKDPRFVERLKSLPQTAGAISIELLESISFEENDEALQQGLKNLRDTNVDIEIDDFGTGHASILSLLRFEPKRLKIDRQLIDPVVASETQRRLVAAIVEIGKSQNIGIVAEGVETMDHARVLAQLGCDVLQGFALARPLPSQTFIEFALRWTPPFAAHGAESVLFESPRHYSATIASKRFSAVRL